LYKLNNEKILHDRIFCLKVYLQEAEDVGLVITGVNAELPLTHLGFDSLGVHFFILLKVYFLKPKLTLKQCNVSRVSVYYQKSYW